jgi:hypothetical protein
LVLLFFEFSDDVPKKVGSLAGRYVERSMGHAQEANPYLWVPGELKDEVDLYPLEELKWVFNKGRDPGLLRQEDTGSVRGQIDDPYNLNPVKSQQAAQNGLSAPASADE